MKRIVLSGFVFILSGVLFAEPRTRVVPRPSVRIRQRQQSVPSPDRNFNSRRDGVHDRIQAVRPQRNWSGSRITQQATVAPPQHHTAIVRNPGIVRDIHAQQRVEVVPNRYYWHSRDGVRYAHYYDHGIHWYGFYHGPNFYWTRLYNDRWWWFDARFNRWDYWWDGYWWWAGPGGATYVYVDNNYYPYENGSVTVQEPEVVAPPENIPSANEGSSWKSPDGKRLVQISGVNSGAYLYDTTNGEPQFLKYLGDDVEKVRFSGGVRGKPLRILVDFKGGSFALSDENGDPLDVDNPDSVPPPPSALPPGTPPNNP